MKPLWSRKHEAPYLLLLYRSRFLVLVLVSGSVMGVADSANWILSPSQAMLSVPAPVLSSPASGCPTRSVVFGNIFTWTILLRLQQIICLCSAQTSGITGSSGPVQYASRK
ncbi:hypothetical protein ILYODFUR_028372 [Ilyodon furcidens]|uniref:Secreted protein n=1 Tax=Ilyodon furcidens TaxID=33524 RepID=A0ABV0VIV4_9TELE